LYKNAEKFSGNEPKSMLDFMYSPLYIRLLDKMTFMVGIFIVLTTVYLIGASPGKYYFYWIGIIWPLLLIKRFFLFSKLGYQFYFTDF
jgi:hypothetical protein